MLRKSLGFTAVAVLTLALGIGANTASSASSTECCSERFIRNPNAFALALVALAACWIPARRAMRVDPIVALRYVVIVASVGQPEKQNFE